MQESFRDLRRLRRIFFLILCFNNHQNEMGQAGSLPSRIGSHSLPYTLMKYCLPTCQPNHPFPPGVLAHTWAVSVASRSDSLFCVIRSHRQVSVPFHLPAHSIPEYGLCVPATSSSFKETLTKQYF